MKRLLIACLLGILLLPVPNGYAVQYGDLSSIRWCPCNPDEQFDSKGSVVMGRTVMCPCDSMYDGYGRTFEKDVRKVQEKVEHVYENALAYKYYIGFEYNKSQVETNNKKKNFNDVIFSSVHGIDVPSGEMIEHQDNIGVVLGFRPHKNFGMEVFYNRTYSDSETSKYDGTSISDPSYHMMHTYTTKYQAFGIDLVGYLPITQYFDIVAFVGLGKYKFDNTAKFEAFYGEDLVYTKSISFNEDELAYRVGGGVQLNIADGVALRLMYKYINVDSDTIHYLQEYSASLRFLF